MCDLALLSHRIEKGNELFVEGHDGLRISSMLETTSPISSTACVTAVFMRLRCPSVACSTSKPRSTSSENRAN